MGSSNRKKKRGRRCNCRSFVVPFLDFPPSRYHDLGTSRRNGLKDGSKNSEAMLVTKVERRRERGKKECRVRASIFVKARVIYLIYNDERIGFSFLLFFFFFFFSIFLALLRGTPFFISIPFLLLPKSPFETMRFKGIPGIWFRWQNL